MASAQQKAKPDSKKNERNDQRRNRKAWSKRGPNGTSKEPSFDSNGVRLHGKGKASGKSICGIRRADFVTMAHKEYPHLRIQDAVQLLTAEMKRLKADNRKQAAQRRRAGLPPLALVYRQRKADEQAAAERRRNGADDKARLPKTKAVADKVKKAGLESVTVDEMRGAMDEFHADFIETVSESLGK